MSIQRLKTGKKVKTKQRVKDYGEVFTPPHIVREMCDLIPVEVWADPSHIFLEPTCGNGNFLFEIVYRRLKAGLRIDQALDTVWGMDILEDNIKECHQRLFELSNKYLTRRLGLTGLTYWNCVVYLVAYIENNIYVTKDSLIDIAPGGSFEKKMSFDALPDDEKEIVILRIRERIRDVKHNKKRDVLEVFFHNIKGDIMADVKIGQVYKVNDQNVFVKIHNKKDGMVFTRFCDANGNDNNLPAEMIESNLFLDAAENGISIEDTYIKIDGVKESSFSTHYTLTKDV